LGALAARGDELLDDDLRRKHVVTFIGDLDHHDKRGDQGRYPLTSEGKPSLASVCCANPELLKQEVDGLYTYVAQGRYSDERAEQLGYETPSPERWRRRTVHVAD
jgi:hypothetical protein